MEHSSFESSFLIASLVTCSAIVVYGSEVVSFVDMSVYRYIFYESACCMHLYIRLSITHFSFSVLSNLQYFKPQEFLSLTVAASMSLSETV